MKEIYIESFKIGFGISFAMITFYFLCWFICNQTILIFQQIRGKKCFM
jgi:hypothetical protein